LALDSAVRTRERREQPTPRSKVSGRERYQFEPPEGQSTTRVIRTYRTRRSQPEPFISRRLCFDRGYRDPYGSRMTTPQTSDETICPVQFHDLWSRATESSGESRLAMAVLVQAIGDLRAFRDGAPGSESQRLYRRARRWIASHDRQWPYSFVNVSEILNIPSARVRLRLLGQDLSCSQLGRQYGSGRFRRHRLLKKLAGSSARSQ
jgi:hypothetical protein